MDLDVLDLESLRCGGDEYDELVDDETPTPTSDPFFFLIGKHTKCIY